MNAQTVLLDWEAPETSATFTHFGSSLDQQNAPVITNPDMSGINTSMMVVEFVKPANSMDFAGTYTSAGLSGIDLTASNQLCLDIWRSAAGSFTVKLENGANGAPNWQRTASTDVTNEWVTLCYDLTLPGEVNNMPAVGNVYDGMALFADLNSVFDADQVNYVDNFVLNQVAVDDVMVTFAVDMAGYTGTFDTVYVSGQFNGWSGNANPMSDADGDGVWTTTIEVAPGLTEYKFQVDQWTDSEQFSGAYYLCTVSDGSGNTNRQSLFADGSDLGTVCWNSCYACGENVFISFDIGTSNITPDPAGIYIAGGGNFGNPGDFVLDDSDGDGIYSGTFEKNAGFSGFYTITNGACPSYSCKEDISGQDCANPDNFNDRFIATVAQDTTIATCFGLCTTDATACGVAAADGMITLSVDAAGFVDGDGNPLAVDSMFLAGAFNGWNGSANQMSDDDGDGVYTITVLLPGGNNEYKFVANDNQFESLDEGGSCTITSGGFTNRIIAVDGDATIDAVCFGSCDACGVVMPSDGMITFSVDVNDVVDADGNMVTVDSAFLAGTFNGWNAAANPMTDADGDGVWEVTVMMPAGSNEYKFVINDFQFEELAEGSSCTLTTGDFTNRVITVDGDATIGTVCYGSCDACGTVTPQDGMITFSVDVNDVVDADGNAVTVDSAFLAGTFNGWTAAANPMTDADGDGVWEVTVMMPAGSNEYKFVINDFQFEELEEGSSCTITTGDFTNRVITVDGDASINTVCYGSCESCATGTNELSDLGIDFQVRPTLVQQELIVSFGTEALPNGATLDVVNTLGQVVISRNVNGLSQTRVAVEQLQTGMYFVRLTVANRQGVLRVLKN